jgi:hypothetical protein
MQSIKLFSLTFIFLGWIGILSADNPLSMNYLADPAAVSVGDSIFYIIADTDYDNVDGYAMKAGYLLSSKDMKNWTDHGEIFRVPRDVPWANGVWAPGAVWHNGKMWIYFPNGGYGVGVVSSSNPAGPYTDPVGKLLVGGSGAISCDGVSWCFDPGIFVDDDGSAYLHWGGGENADRPYGNNFSIVKLKNDMITADGPIIRMTGMSNSFEASYITKRNGLYYLSYSAADLTIRYSTGNSPTGPWTYRGTVLANPNINGQNINAYNNNHHGFADFKGNTYAAYHDRRAAIARNDPEPAFHRSVSIDKLEYNADGTFKSLVFTNSGPAQVGTFNPYDSIPAVTSSLSNSIKTQSVAPSGGNPGPNLLIPLPSGNNGSWLRLSNVNFGTSSNPIEFWVNAASTNANNKVEIRTGSPTGTLAGTCSLPSTGSMNTFVSTDCSVTGLSGVVAQLYLKFTGSDNSAAIKWWRFSGGTYVPPQPPRQTAYDTLNIMTLPGTIEAENYDMGGEGLAYHDEDVENAGNIYRTDGVDIDLNDGNGYAVGWTVAGEWLEYTVNVEQAGTFYWEARVATGADNAAFRILLDGVDITGSVAVPNTTDWKIFTTISGAMPAITTGQKVLRLEIEGSYVNIDWIRIGEAPVGLVPGQSLKYLNSQSSGFLVYDLVGNLQGRLDSDQDLSLQVQTLTGRSGVWLIKSTGSNSIRKVVTH